MNFPNKLSNETRELNKVKSKNIFKNLKIDYFLQKVFNNLNTRKSLEIIKCNKNIHKRLNINLNDYKNYSQLYSSNEIGIIPFKNKSGTFINIDEDESYYHIFFNDNSEEIKMNYINEYNKITKINIIIDYHVKSFEKLFYKCNCIESLYFKKFNRNNIINMSAMFCYCLN